LAADLPAVTYQIGANGLLSLANVGETLSDAACGTMAHIEAHLQMENEAPVTTAYKTVYDGAGRFDARQQGPAPPHRLYFNEA